MKNVLRSALVIFFSLNLASLTSAETIDQKPDLETLKRSLSANQYLINRFNLEYANLIKEQGQSANEKLALKIADVKNKIAVLKNGNERIVNQLSQSSKPNSIEDVSPQYLTGRDWLSMDPKGKEMYIFSTMGALVKKEVLTIKPSDYYISSLDKLIAHNSSYQARNLDDMLLLIIYKNEPASRSAISGFHRINESELERVE